MGKARQDDDDDDGDDNDDDFAPSAQLLLWCPCLGVSS